MNAKLALLLVLAIVVPTTARAQMSSSTGVVIQETPVRIDPTAKVPLTTLARGEDVTVLAVQGGWVQVAFEDLRYGRRVGYIPQAMVKITTPDSPAASPAVAASARPAGRAPVRSVATEFPSSTPATSAGGRGATRGVTSIGDAFSGAADAPASAPVSAAAASSFSAARGGRARVSPKKGMPVTLMIPRALLKEDDDRASRTVPELGADIVGAGAAGASVSGVTEWMQAGLPSLLEASIGKITRKKDYTALELLTTAPQGAVKIVTLRFADSVADPEATLGQLLVEGGPDTPSALRYREEAYTAVADAVFTGDLSNLAPERKLSILATLQRAAGAPDVHLHDGRVYASFDLGADGRVFDDRSADQASIIAYVLNTTVLAQARKMVVSLADVPELHGMRVRYRIPHQATPRSPAKDYQLELIADMRLVRALAGGEVTNPAFVDGSTLLVDGQPVRVDLGH